MSGPIPKAIAETFAGMSRRISGGMIRTPVRDGWRLPMAETPSWHTSGVRWMISNHFRGYRSSLAQLPGYRL